MRNVIKTSVVLGIAAFFVGYYSEDMIKSVKKYYAVSVVTSRMIKDYQNGIITKEAMMNPEIRSHLIAFYVQDYYQK